MTQDDIVIIYEAPKIKPPEFRLYYDEEGKVLFYSGQEQEGKYVIIDAQTYAEGRMDLRIINGKILRNQDGSVIAKLKPDANEGITCHKDDISIVVPHNFKNLQKWKLNIYEARNN